MKISWRKICVFILTQKRKLLFFYEKRPNKMNIEQQYPLFLKRSKDRRQEKIFPNFLKSVKKKFLKTLRVLTKPTVKPLKASKLRFLRSI